jgi:uncharacterized membrane protein (DUF485 family)
MSLAAALPVKALPMAPTRQIRTAEASMDPGAYQRIESNPKFRELIEVRGRFALILTIAMLVIYFGFVLLVAFGKGFLATPIGGSVVTIGIPLGLFVIVSAFVLTGIYVAKANATFDRLNADILREVK